MSLTADVAAQRMLPRAVLVIPAYNESAEIGRSLHRVAAYLDSELPEFNWQVLIVDDGSSDETVEVVTETARDLTVPVQLVQHDVNAGLGKALCTAFANADADLLVTIDADLSYDVEHIGRLARAWEETRAAVVIASPYAKGGRSVAVPRKLRMRSKAANYYLRLTSWRSLRTFTGMVRAYDGAFLRNLPIGSDGVVINVELIRKAHILGLPVIEVPATLNWSGLAARRSRSPVISKRAWRETRRTVREGLLFHPRLYLLAPGLVIAVGALLAALGSTDAAVSLAIAAAVLLVIGGLLGIGYRNDFRDFRVDFARAAASPEWPERALTRWTRRRRHPDAHVGTPGDS